MNFSLCANILGFAQTVTYATCNCMPGLLDNSEHRDSYVCSITTIESALAGCLYCKQ